MAKMIVAAAALSMLVANSVAAPVTVNMGELLEAAETDALGKHHLWFSFIDHSTETGPPANNKARCGEVDAAPRMPADIFELRNIGRLSLYVSITIESYSNLLINNPTWSPGTKLELGRCRTKGFSEQVGGVQGINWVSPALMGPICKKQCACNYPACQDVPDDPSAGKFCSLCGPKYNANFVVDVWMPPSDDDYTQDDVYAADSCNGLSKRKCGRASGPYGVGCDYDKKSQTCAKRTVEEE